MIMLFIYFFEKKNFSTLVFLLLLDFILIGGILPLIERKVLSLIQRRVGPHYIGYKGRLQFIADAIKVFLKDFVYLSKINNCIFLILPFIYIYINSFLCLFFFFDINICVIQFDYYLIYIYIILISSNIILFFTGIFSKNKFSMISSDRIASYIFSLDILLGMLIVIIVTFAQSFNLADLRFGKFLGIINIHFIPLLPLIILVFLIDANKAPYDLFEAESELVMGYTTEYSGFLFGIYVLTEYMHILFFSFLIVNIYF